MGQHLWKLSASEIGEMVNNKEISPVEVMDQTLQRIEKRNPSLNAFTYVKGDEAMEEAKRVEKRIMAGEYVGPFAGVPIALKDFLPSKKGWMNSHGGVPSLVRVDDADSMFYAAARRLGAIAVGKTNAPAFGFSGACQNVMYGHTNNPFDASRTSGGSSGGSAAAVADGLVYMAEGGDAGGSIRIPAGWCNLFGMKPSLGTVPSYCRPDAWAATHPYCFNGALTRTVKDSAIMLTAMARYNPRDPISLPINSGRDFEQLRKKSIEGMRIAITGDFGLYPVDTEILCKVAETAVKLESAGATVEYVTFDFKHTLNEILACWAWSISLDTALDIKHWKQETGYDLYEHADEVPEEFITFQHIAESVGLDDMYRFNLIRTDILDNFEGIFDNFDIIVSPTAICEPMKHEMNGHMTGLVGGTRLAPVYDFIGFAETPLVNFVGYPAASVPAGFTQNGLPVGMQVIGKQYHDDDVFAVANAVEYIQPWNDTYALTLARDLSKINNFTIGDKL